MHKPLKIIGFMSQNRDIVASNIHASASTARLSLVLGAAIAALVLGGCGSDANPLSSGNGSSPPSSGAPPTGTPPPDQGKPPSGNSPEDEAPPDNNPPGNDEPPPSAPPSPSTFSVTLSWQAPTERADGSPLTDLAGFRIYYGDEREDLDVVIDLDNPGLSRYVVENLTAGTWYFSMTAYDGGGLQSSPSPTVSATLN